MGSAVRAACKCGYNSEFLIGGGMLDFMKMCHFPALCHECNNIVGVNLIARTPRCPKCKSKNLTAYDQPEIIKRRGKNVVASWNMEEKLGRELELTDGDYLCPSCGDFHLTFAHTGLMWD